MIRFEDVSKKYEDGTISLDDVSFLVDAGEFVFVTGPSGAGKTSLLNLIVRDDLPSEGLVFVEDEDVSKMKKDQIPNLRRKVGYIFQDFKLLPSLNVYENVALAMEVVEKPDDEIAKTVKEMLDLVGLSGQINRFPSQLSGGEKQRVAIARALVHSPKILLADEPTGMIDLAAGWEIMNLLEKIQALGSTVLVATHNLDIVKSMKKRNIVLEKGKVVSDSKK